MNNIYINQLNEMLNLIEEKHIDPYFNISKEELKKYVDEITGKYELNDDYDFYYVASLILKRMFEVYDSHTTLYFKNNNCNIPIRIKYIDNQLYIVKTNEDNRDILYGQILKINDVDIKILIDELEKATAYSTIGFLKFRIETTFYKENKLKSLPSIKNDSDSFKYTVLVDDKIIEKDLRVSDTKFGINKNYTYSIDDDVMIINYTACNEKYKGQMIEFVEKIKQESVEKNISKYVINIRGNLGGNSEIIKPLIEYLKDKDIITLVDNEVFSSGRFSLIDLMHIGSKTVGTGIGTSLNCFGNAPTNEFKNYYFPISTKYFGYVNGQLIDFKKEQYIDGKNIFIEQHLFEPIIYEPDYFIEETLEDIIHERDIALEYAVNLIKEQKTNQI